MTPGVVTSAVPPDLADASGAVSLLTVKHAFFRSRLYLEAYLLGALALRARLAVALLCVSH